jgi:hypothetical protein
VRRRVWEPDRLGTTPRRFGATVSPRVRDEIAQYWQRDTIQPNSKPATAPFIPEGDGVCRYESVNIRRRQPEHDGLTIGRQRGKDLVVNPEIGASKV